MSTKTELQTPEERALQGKLLQNSISTVLEFEQSFKLYSYRIISTDDFINGINKIMETYAATSDKIHEEHEQANA